MKNTRQRSAEGGQLAAQRSKTEEDKPMFPITPLKALLRSRLNESKHPRQIDAEAAERLNSYLAEVAGIIAEEASNGNYYKVTVLDIERGIELIRLRTLRDYLKEKDSLATLQAEVAARLAMIEPRGPGE